MVSTDAISFTDKWTLFKTLPDQPEIALADVKPGDVVYRATHWSIHKWWAWHVACVDRDSYRSSLIVFSSFKGGKFYTFEMPIGLHFYKGVTLTGQQLDDVRNLLLRRYFRMWNEEEAGPYIAPELPAAHWKRNMGMHVPPPFERWLQSEDGKQIVDYVEGLLNG